MANFFDQFDATDAPRSTPVRVPASIRNNNPGAQWPGPSATRFGATGFETLNDGQGNKIARFDTPEAGAAAQFDLLNRRYAGMPLTDAIRKWSGGNSSDAYANSVAQAIGIKPTDVLTPEILSDPARAVPFAKAMARIEAGRDFPMSDDQWMAAHQMAFAPQQPKAAGVAAIDKAMQGGGGARVANFFDQFDEPGGVNTPAGFNAAFSGMPAQNASPADRQALMREGQQRAGLSPSGRPSVDISPTPSAPTSSPPSSVPAGAPAPTALSASNEGVLRGLTFGFGDEIMAGMLTPVEMAVRAARGEDWSPGASYDAALERERGIQQQASEQFPIASTVGDVAGSLMTGGTLAKGGVTLLNTAQPTVAGLIGRGAAEGAIYGAARGAGEGEGVQDRVAGAAQGALTGGVVGGALGGWAGASASRQAKALLPRIEELKASGSAAYKAAEDAGVVLRPESMQRLGNEMATAMKEFGFNPRLHPGGQAIIDELSAISSSNATLKDLEIVRRVAGQAARSQDRSTQELAGRLIDKIDTFLTGLKPTDIAMGDRAAGVRALTDARKYWAQYRRLDQVERAMMKAEDRAASTGAGGNTENAIRQNIRAILDKGARGFTPDEVEAMRRVVRGGPIENIARLLGKMAPTGIVSGGLSSGAGLAAGGPTGAVALPLLGLGSKKLAETLTNRNVQSLLDIIRSGGKLPQLSQLRPEQVQAIEAVLQALSGQSVEQLPQMLNAPQTMP